MSLDTALEQASAIVPECIAAGCVDVASGMLLSAKTVDQQPSEVINLLAAATADLFEGPNILMIESLLKRKRCRSDDDHHYFQEIIINSDNLIHVFMRGKTHPQYITVFVCRNTANFGMALITARTVLPMIEAAIG
jgi:hypothetical protein